MLSFSVEVGNVIAYTSHYSPNSTRKELLKKTTGIENGMAELYAKQVLELAIQNIEESSGSFNFEWDGSEDNYDDLIYHGMRITLYSTAVEWIDANMPQMYCRSMFIP